MERRPPDHPNGIRALQVGCGPKHLRPDWWNTDLSFFKGVDETLDVTQPWRWSSVLDYVYGEHFLEHLTLEQAIAFLTNAGQALRPGGRIRLSTPSLEWVLSKHLANFQTDPSDDERHISNTLGTNRSFRGWGHQFLYSRTFLGWLLGQHGYVDIRFFDYGMSDDPKLANLELHHQAGVAKGFPAVWIVEAARGEVSIGIREEATSRIERDFDRYVRSGH